MNATSNALNFLIENHTAYYELCFSLTQPEQNGPSPFFAIGLFLGKNSSFTQSGLDQINAIELVHGFGEWEKAETHRNLVASGFSEFAAIGEPMNISEIKG